MKLIIILIIILKLAITDCKSLYDNKNLTRKQPKQFKNIILNANTITKMNFDEKLSIECPIQDLKSVKNNRETHYNKKKSTPIFITTWYKIYIFHFLNSLPYLNLNSSFFYRSIYSNKTNYKIFILDQKNGNRNSQ